MNTIPTDPNHHRPHNPAGPVAYLLTFNTYGSWLHGDERGSVDRNFQNIPGTPVLSPDPTFHQRDQSRLKRAPVTFTQAQRDVVDKVDKTIREVAAHNGWVLHALNVRTQHVHVVITTGVGKVPEPAMNSLKSWCTRRMRENGLLGDGEQPWSRHGSTRYLWSEADLVAACDYVTNQQD